MVAMSVFAASAQAAVITPVGANSSTQWDAARPAGDMIDGSLLSGGGTRGDILIDDESGDGQPVQTRSFAGQSGVTHIRLTNLTAFGSTDFIAISEIRFAGEPTTDPIPEPASLAMGLASLALDAARRRRG